MDTLEAPKLLEVKLPVCPECGAVGKLPGHSYSGRWTCSGSTTKGHVRKNMVYKLFRQVPDEDEG